MKKLTLKMLERMRITSALAESKGNQRIAAGELGISIRTLQRKLKRYDQEDHAKEQAALREPANEQDQA